MRHDWWRPEDGLACGLLVSVRDPHEAAAAVAGGATIIDVKEPSRGPLGRADAAVAAAVATAVGRRRPWTIAAGELHGGATEVLRHLRDVCRLLPADATPPAAVKVGLAGVGQGAAAWEAEITAFVAGAETGIDPIPVAYLDWEAAAAPAPEAVVAVAGRAGCRAVLFDTFDKRAAGALAPPLVSRLPGWIAAARRAGLAVALAGRIGAADIPAALGLGPDVLGFRSAACDGGRLGRISRKLVCRLGTLCRPSAPVPGGDDSGARA